MRKFCVAAILASTALSAPALAKDDYWYVSLQGGPSLFENQNHRVVTNGQVASNVAVNTSTNTGFNVGGEIGYDFGMFRTGIEIGFQRAGIDGVNNLGNIASVGANGINSVNSGNASALSFMLNGMFDAVSSEKWTGSVGGGVGVAQYKASKFATGTANAVNPAFLNDSDTGFAWQLMAGIRRALSDNVDLNLGYKYFNMPKINTVSSNGTPLRSKLTTHNLMLGFTYNFGGEPPAPPPPPPAPEPAPVQEVAPPPPPPPPPPGPFIIFFDWDKSVITPEADKILQDAAAAYASTGQVAIQLAGHADKSGTDAYNDALSGRRSTAATKRLVELGVPESAITSANFGEGKPLVDTADGVREPQNRRVEIVFPPKQ